MEPGYCIVPVVLWMTGALVVIVLFVLCSPSFEKRFGEGSTRSLLIGLLLCSLGILGGVFFESTDSETILFASHKKGLIVQLSRNCFHQVTRKQIVPIDSITEIAIEKRIAYRRGRRRETPQLVLKTKEQSFYPTSTDQPIEEQYKELCEFLRDPASPDYYYEKDSRAHIFLVSSLVCLVGLFFLKKAFFDCGEFGSTKRDLLKLIKGMSTKSESHKYQLIGNILIYTAGKMSDEILNGNDLPLAGMRRLAARYGGGLFGMGRLTAKETQMVLAESSIFLFYWLDRYNLNNNKNSEVLRTAVFEDIVLAHFLAIIPDIYPLSESRLTLYKNCNKGSAELINADSFFVENINHILLYKKVKRDEYSQNKALASKRRVLCLQQSNFYLVYRRCIEAMLQEDIEELSAYETAALLNHSLKELKLQDARAFCASSEAFSGRAEMVPKSSVERTLARRA